ncbi:MAG: HPr family phosphocarrier protein [Candidatus Eisenbacteria bacterium]|jgi:phosphotransferase system HPr (HPr) family protein
MIERKVTITNKLGLHLRAAAVLVQTASAFRSDIRIRRDDKNIEVDAKSIMGVLGLEGAIGTELVVKARGPDEEDALAIVVSLIESKFNEEE